jgi:hypothetical protein
MSKNWQVHLVKFLHNLLPMARFLNIFDGGQQCCTLCKRCEADRDHIMRYPCLSLPRALVEGMHSEHCRVLSREADVPIVDTSAHVRIGGLV